MKHSCTLPWDPSLFVPVTISAKDFFDKSTSCEEDKVKIQSFSDPKKKMHGTIDIDTLEIATFINGKVQKFKANNRNLLITFDCPIDTQSSKDCIRASVYWYCEGNSQYKAKIFTELPITEMVNSIAFGLHQLEERHWANCFALNKLKTIHIAFDRALKEEGKIGKFKIDSLKDLVIEPLHPLPKIKKGEAKLNPNLILSSLVNATYMQQHPQEYLYVRTCFQDSAQASSLILKNKSVVKYPNGAKVAQYF